MQSSGLSMATCRELTKQALERAKKERWNAFVTLNEEGALRQAEESDKRLKEGRARRLEGLLLAYKDMFCTRGLRTTAGSRMLENFVPPYSAHVVDLLEAEGAICVGKCNQDEFAMGSASITGFSGAVVNPLSDKIGRDLSAGGSSGGSAAAVAAGIVTAALGTDTGGSVRQPAAFTGCVGVKPTYGRCSRFGIIAYASSLDQAGLFARSVKDAAKVLECMMGYDPRDMTCADLPAPKLVEACQKKDTLKIGILLPTEQHHEYLSILEDWNKELKKTLKKIPSFQVRELEEKDIPILPLLDPESGILKAYYIIAMAEASSNLARYDGVRYTHRAKESKEGYTIDEMISNSRSEGFGFEVKRRILMGTHVLSAGYYDAVYVQAQKIRRLVSETFNKIFETYDILLSPVTPNTAFTLEQAVNEPLAEWMYLQDFFTVPASLAGLPCMSLPLTKDASGLPIGLQLIAPAFQEERLFAAASHFEKIIGYKA